MGNLHLKNIYANIGAGLELVNSKTCRCARGADHDVKPAATFAQLAAASDGRITLSHLK